MVLLASLLAVTGWTVAPAALAADVTGVLVAGTPRAVRTTQPGQQVRLRLPVTAPTAAPAVVRITGFTAAPQDAGSTQVQVEQGGVVVRDVGQLLPGMTAWTDQLNTGQGGTVDPGRPAVLAFVPAPEQTVAFTVEVAVPRSTTVPVRSGQPVTAVFRGPGDRTQLTFTPRSGQRVLVRRSTDPLGTQLALTSAAGTGYAAHDLPDAPGHSALLPAADGSRHTLTVTAPLAATGRVTVTVLLVDDPQVHADGVTTIGWAAMQQPRLLFTGTAGARPALLLSVPPGQAWNAVTAVVQDRDGATVATATEAITPTTTFLEFDRPLPTGGTYAVVLAADGLAAGSLGARLIAVTDQHLTATPGEPLRVTFGTPGQRAYVAVPVQYGQYLSWAVHGSTVPATGLELWWGPAPDGGRQLDRTVVTGADGTGTLAAWEPLGTDAYTVVVDPAGAATGTLDLTVGGTDRPAPSS